MNKQLILLLIASVVVGMTVPAMAISATGTATGGNNWGTLAVNPTSWNSANSAVNQILTNNGAQSNSATTTSTSGDAAGINPAMASTGALQVTGSADGSGRDSDPETCDNEANDNKAEAESGDSDVESGDSGNMVIQANVIAQMADADVETEQENEQETEISVEQDSSSEVEPSVEVEDSNILVDNDGNEGGWGDLFADSNEIFVIPIFG